MRAAVGDRLAVIAKLNMADGVTGGLWLDESVLVARMLEADGALHAIELTGGSSLENPTLGQDSESAKRHRSRLRGDGEPSPQRRSRTARFPEMFFRPSSRIHSRLVNATDR